MKLEVLCIMYKDLIKRGVGTVTIESEMMRQVHERESGPTGHRLIATERACDEQKDVERELGEKNECSLSQCWREPKIVRKLLSLRKRVISTQLAKAKKVLRDELRLLASISTRQKTSEAREAAREASRRTWSELHPQHQRKVSHLQKRAEECGKHRTCKKLDKIWGERVSRRHVTSLASAEQGESECNKVIGVVVEDSPGCEQECTGLDGDGAAGYEELENSDKACMEEWVEHLVLKTTRSRRVDDLVDGVPVGDLLQGGEEEGDDEVHVHQVRDAILHEDDDVEDNPSNLASGGSQGGRGGLESCPTSTHPSTLQPKEGLSASNPHHYNKKT